MGFNSFNDKVLDALDAPVVRERIQKLIHETIFDIHLENMTGVDDLDNLHLSQIETKAQVLPEQKLQEQLDKQNKRICELEKMLQQADKANLELKVDTQKKQVQIDTLVDEKSQLNHTVQHLQEVLSQNQQKNGELSAQMECIIHQKEEIKIEHEQAVVALEKQTRILKNLEPMLCTVTELIKIYQEYRTLPSERRNALNKILNEENMIAFLVYGSQFENIRALWEYARSEERNIPDDQRKVLVKTIRYFICQINLLYNPPLYSLIEDPLGTDFAPERHIKAEGSSPYQSKIQEVLLPGIWNERKQQFVCKCLVRY